MKLWKKGLAALTAGLLCLGSVGLSGVELPASADVPYFYDGTYGDLYYDVIDAVEIRITGCEKEVTAVEIPAEIAGKPVTSVGRSAFSGCNSLAAVTIPDSVTSIEKSAFSGCNNLTIYGYARSYAQKYAAENNIRFALIGGLLRGDVDGSGGIDSTDIFYTMLYIANVAVGNDGGLTLEQIAAADVDGSGKVDSTDVFYMMYYVAPHGVGKDVSWEEVLAK